MPDEVIGVQLQVDANQGKQSLKEFRGLIKEAQGDLIAMSEKFGKTSIEAQTAAKRVAELKNQLGDAKKLSDAFNPDQKFKALSQSLNGVLGGFTALTGAMGLLGVESEDVQKQLLKVQSAMAFSQGINQVGEAIQSFKALGATIINTLGKGGLMGIAIAGVTALGLAIAGVFNKSKQLSIQQAALNEVNKEAAKIYVSERAELDKLINPLKDQTLSRQEQLAAIKKIQETYPSYFKDLKIEEGHITGITAGYNALVKAIALKARATAAANILAKDEEKLLELGFGAGITTEEEAKAFVDTLRQRTDIISKEIVRQADIVIKKRKFLQDIIAGGETITTKGGGTTADKKAESEAQRQKEERELQAEKDKLEKMRQLRASFDKIETADDIKKEEEKRKAQAQKDLDDLRQSLEGKVLLQKNADLQLIQSDKERSDAERDQAAYRTAISQAEADEKVLTAQFVSDQLSIIADLVGKQTAAGKVLAIASATINTYLAASKALAGDYSVYGPAAPFVRVATVISTIALGLKQVKEILKVQVPGGGGGGSVPAAGGALSAQAPQAQLPLATQTLLNQGQLNQIGNAANRSFVVESDVTNNQERIRRLNRSARL